MAKNEPKVAVQFEDPEPLPEPGEARRDALKARQDRLDEAADDFNSKVEAYKINPEAMKPINEVASQVHLLSLKKPDPEFDYCWANCRAANGIQVARKEAEGWEIVRKNHNESEGQRIDEFGRVRVGDVVLMRLRKDINLQLKQADRARRMARQASIGADLMEMGAKHGVVVRDHLNPNELQRMQAQQIAGQQFNRMLRSGNVPGMQMRRR